ncbi:hypothetical protein [Vibrio sp. 2-1(7)]|uniref:hypothetical protein n=1 Tax=Vibrio sp. 2-1(7) TaxID=2591011 RepID=UPI0014831A20|nr:hypothetical protein [Vibrio sp. 2-1(7)]NNN64412.1 hypothetical protein [Vibrio sp. 2-1(7)]
MKPLRKNSAFGKPISQCGLSTKLLKPRGTYNTKENVFSASKFAFVPTNSPCRVAAKNKLSVALLCQHQRTKQPLEHLQNFGFKQLKLSFDHRR